MSRPSGTLRRWAIRGFLGGLVYLLVGGALHALIEERAPTVDEHPRAGDILVNRVAGERVVFRQAPAAGRDGLSLLDVTLDAHGAVPVAHIHPDAVEVFTVKEGRVIATVEGEAKTLGPGESVTVPAGHAHALRNATSAPARVEVQLEPTGRMHLALVQVHGFLDEAGATPGVSGFLQMLRFAERYRVYLAGPPVWLQRLGIFALAPTARLLGHTGFEPRYAADARSRGTAAVVIP